MILSNKKGDEKTVFSEVFHGCIFVVRVSTRRLVCYFCDYPVLAHHSISITAIV